MNLIILFEICWKMGMFLIKTRETSEKLRQRCSEDKGVQKCLIKILKIFVKESKFAGLEARNFFTKVFQGF